ncbi:MAG: METTL5 family protein [Candidatus Hadarchaeota archaeon]|nr:METTL5 family protein [Candidatus Hadarchaeota archaeon]
MTPGDVAAALLHLAYVRGGIKDKVVYDLGCGTGRLAIGAALLGAREVVGVDIDQRALTVAEQNALQVGAEVRWMKRDVKELETSGVDTVIQNPPFGVQRKGADMLFLRKALELANEVYSLHKATPQNREFIAKRVKKIRGKITDRVELTFQIPRQFEFHTRNIYKFEVDLYRMEGEDKDG